MKINLQFIKQFNPCESGVAEYIDAGYYNFNGTVLEFLSLDKISINNKLWVVLRTEIISENDLHELACKFSESVLHIFENQYPNDKRPRLAIEAKRKWISGEISIDELEAASVASVAAWAAASVAARVAARAARDAASVAARAATGENQLNIVIEYFKSKEVKNEQ